MERKLTYDEIVKTVECCFRLVCGCVGCPFDGETDCLRKAGEAILDLINRQKAESEELEAEIDKQYEQAKADILGNMSDGGTSCHWCIDQHRAAAIKDFAEGAGVMITEVYNKHIFGENDLEAEEKDAIINFSDDIIRGFDGLVKEMTEDSDGKL